MGIVMGSRIRMGIKTITIHNIAFSFAYREGVFILMPSTFRYWYKYFLNLSHLSAYTVPGSE